MNDTIYAHAARWGDAFGGTFGDQGTRTHADWAAEIDFVRNCMEDRVDVVENQFRDDGLWPLP